MPRRFPLIALLLFGALLLSRAASAQVVRVTVTDAAGTPVEDAMLRLEGPDLTLVRAAFSGANGRGALRVPAGAYVLRVQRSGFTPSEQRLQVAAGETAVRVQLRPQPLVLDTLQVVTRGENERGRDAFRRRSLTEDGVFLDPEYFAQRYRGALYVGDLMRGAPGIILSMEPRTGRPRVINGRQWNCFNTLMNGEPYRGPGPIDNWIKPGNLVGVEIYHWSSRVPQEYRRYAWQDVRGRPSLPCGLIIYWTRSRW
ncbi:MAG TPA: carboxypeptidase-like regulatory domain-containing protein [Longimicrobium sp.]|nr:carboxypeptidase-like regulatory domain-containing protein [Longimicrobium sp.]